MLTIYYSPHATSVDNEAGRASGHADVPLSTVGRRQAYELGRHYETIDLAAVFSSDLQRAAHTAEIAFEDRALPRILDARLRECDYGEMTQYPFAQVEQERARRIEEPFPNGESIRQVVQRVGTFLQAVLQTYDGQTLVVISHGIPRYGFEYWCGNAALEDIVCVPHVWLDVPIWRYELRVSNLARNR